MKKNYSHIIGCLCLFFILAVSMPVFAQQNAKRITVEEALNFISKKYNAKFAYKHDAIKGKTTTDGNLKAKSLEQALKQVLYPNDLLFLYVSEGNYTIVSRNQSALSPTAPAAASPSAEKSDEIFISGKVYDENNKPLPGATVKSMTSNKTATTNDEGFFSAFFPPNTSQVNISYLGYQSQIVSVKSGGKALSVTMVVSNASQLEEVNVVSNGYQTLPKERSTGAYGIVTAKDLEKIPVANVMQRLESLIPGVKVTLSSGDNSFVYGNTQVAINGGTRNIGKSDYNVAIRGSSTFQGESFPLVVVDGGITEMDLSTLNPNDIENITFLKDAAAASIWGVRAANGVIVITTKKGKMNQSPSIAFTATASISNSPNLDYFRMMNSAQAINFESELVNKGLIIAPSNTTALGNPVSDVTDLLFKYKNGAISQSAYDAAISMYSARDSKSQVQQYLLRPASNQQYNFSVGGGGNATTYFYSASYSKENPYTIGNGGDRLTVTLNNTFKLFKKATLTTNIKGSFLDYKNNGISFNTLYSPTATTFMPYNQIVDDNGNRVLSSRRYYSGWVNSLYPKGYLNWGYNPLNELENTDATQKDNNYSVNLNLNVPIAKGFSATAFYSTERSFSQTRRFYNDNTYYYRDLVNSFTVNPATGNAKNAIGLIPGSGILSQVNSSGNNYALRGQLNYDGHLGADHQLTALAGTEIRQTSLGQGASTFYGYNLSTGLSRNVDFSTPYPTLQGFNQNLGGAPSQLDKTRRYLSYYSNASYTYKQKYTLTGSVRYDDYNNFGVDRKFRATPLWSMGGKWDISKESIFHGQSWLNNLSLRATYGVNGNISTLIYPFTWISLGSGDPATGLPNATINTPANPSLRWEKTYATNIGLDFGVLNNRISGSVDVYRKAGRDLYYTFPLSGTYGVNQLTINSAQMNGKGVDVSLNGVEYTSKDWDITSTLNYAYNTNKVDDERIIPNSSFFSNPAFGPALNGYPNDKLFVYRNAGLDATGLTQVYDENNKIVTAGQNLTNFNAFSYAGRVNPPHFGSFNQSIRFKDFTLMAIATYQFGSVFLRPTVSAYPSSRLGTKYDLSEDVDKRWRKPGDEAFTNVPGAAGVFSPVSLTRYQQSDINVLKGDYIRLRELSLSYRIPVSKITNMVRAASFNFAVRNLGLLWRANKLGFDPDFTGNLSASTLTLPATVSYNFTLNVNF